MAEESKTDDETFQASPEMAQKILDALEGNEVEGFKFAELMPRVDPKRAPLRPKDLSAKGGVEAPWTTWRLTS